MLLKKLPNLIRNKVLECCFGSFCFKKSFISKLKNTITVASLRFTNLIRVRIAIASPMQSRAMGFIALVNTMMFPQSLVFRCEVMKSPRYVVPRKNVEKMSTYTRFPRLQKVQQSLRRSYFFSFVSSLQSVQRVDRFISASKILPRYQKECEEKCQRVVKEHSISVLTSFR